MRIAADVRLREKGRIGQRKMEQLAAEIERHAARIEPA